MSIELLVNKLIEKKLKISTAESCTGGLLAKSITDVSGCSEIFELGIVAYANRIKNEFLLVSDEILTEYGAVSSQCSEAMARGLAKASNADINVSVTGIAGPGGATKTKPVGLIYFSVYLKNLNKLMTFELKLLGDRDQNRHECVAIIVEKLMEIVDNLA